MARVKGTVLIDFIKTIKADKTGACAAMLTDQDRQILSQRILPSGWYPYETFKSCFNAVVKVLAKGDMNKVREWGKFYGEAIITAVYKGVIKEGAPLESLQKYSIYTQNIFDAGEVTVSVVSDREAVVTIRNIDPGFEPIYYIMLGWYERSLELCGVKELKSEFLSKSWQGQPETKIRFSWK